MRQNTVRAIFFLALCFTGASNATEDYSIADLVEIESLELLDETDARWLFSFTPIVKSIDEESRVTYGNYEFVGDRDGE